MDAPRTAVRLTIALVLLVGAAMLAWSLRDGAPAVPTAVTQRDGSDFPVPRERGVYEAEWDGEPVMVVLATSADLEAARAVHGEATTLAIPLDNGLFAFALSGRSTHLGCTVAWHAPENASALVGGFFLDVCHQGSWDPFAQGAHIQGPGEAPLALLPLEELDGFFLATGFDGHVGP